MWKQSASRVFRLMGCRANIILRLEDQTFGSSMKTLVKVVVLDQVSQPSFQPYCHTYVRTDRACEHAHASHRHISRARRPWFLSGLILTCQSASSKQTSFRRILFVPACNRWSPFITPSPSLPTPCPRTLPAC